MERGRLEQVPERARERLEERVEDEELARERARPLLVLERQGHDREDAHDEQHRRLLGRRAKVGAARPGLAAPQVAVQDARPRQLERKEQRLLELVVDATGADAGVQRLGERRVQVVRVEEPGEDARRGSVSRPAADARAGRTREGLTRAGRGSAR